MKSLKFAAGVRMGAIIAIIATLSACASGPTATPYVSAKVSCTQSGGAWNSYGAGRCFTEGDKLSSQVMLNMYTEPVRVTGNSTK
jgi:hypothetical protein